jgi:hypothetical protein
MLYGRSEEKAEAPPRNDGGEDAGAVLNGLVSGLTSLEHFAESRKSIAGDQAVALTAALVEAIDRLNAVADRVSATADKTRARAAG